MNFLQRIRMHAEWTPHKPAIIGVGRVLTFAELASAIVSLERRLAAAGVRRGQLAALVIEDRLKQTVAFLALAQAGVTSTPVSGDITAATQIGADVYLTDRSINVGKKARKIFIQDDWFTDAAPASTLGATSLAADEAATVWFSSGSTGRRKAFATSWDSLVNAVDNNRVLMQAERYERGCLLTGASGSAGMTDVLAFLSSGGTAILLSYEEDVLKAAELFGADFISLSTYQLSRLVGLLRQGQGSMRTIRGVKYGGGRAGAALLREAMARITPNIRNSYGATEAGRSAACLASQTLERPGYVGVVAPWARVEIVDEEDQVLERGREGRVRIRTNSMNLPFEGLGKRYAPAADAWFYPGDIGRLLGDGGLMITGRSSTIVNIGGLKLALEDIEDAICAHPRIREAAAYSQSPEGAGLEEIMLLIVPADIGPTGELIDWCVKTVTQLRPENVRAVASLPRTVAGKIARAQLGQPTH